MSAPTVVVRPVGSPLPLGFLALAVSGAALLAGCEETGSASSYRAYAPIPQETLALMEAKGTVKDASASASATFTQYKSWIEWETKRSSNSLSKTLQVSPGCSLLLVRW